MTMRYGTTVYDTDDLSQARTPEAVPEHAVAAVYWRPPEIELSTTEGCWSVWDVDPDAQEELWPHAPADVGLALLDGPGDLDPEVLLAAVRQHYRQDVELGPWGTGPQHGVHGSHGTIIRWYETPRYPVLPR